MTHGSDVKRILKQQSYGIAKYLMVTFLDCMNRRETAYNTMFSKEHTSYSPIIKSHKVPTVILSTTIFHNMVKFLNDNVNDLQPLKDEEEMNQTPPDEDYNAQQTELGTKYFFL